MVTVIVSDQAKEMSEENSLTPEQNQAYINIVGEEYAKADQAEEAYQGEYASDEEFAESMADDIGYERRAEWPYSCIDWEQAAKELMWDYTEDSNYYFRNL